MTPFVFPRDTYKVHVCIHSDSKSVCESRPRFPLQSKITPRNQKRVNVRSASKCGGVSPLIHLRPSSLSALWKEKKKKNNTPVQNPNHMGACQFAQMPYSRSSCAVRVQAQVTTAAWGSSRQLKGFYFTGGSQQMSRQVKAHSGVRRCTRLESNGEDCIHLHSRGCERSLVSCEKAYKRHRSKETTSDGIVKEQGTRRSIRRGSDRPSYVHILSGTT